MRVLVALSWLALILGPEVLLSQEPALVGEYLGSSGCFDCHEIPSPAAEERLKTDFFINLTEAKNWVFKDKHARAFINVRDTDLGKQMLEILGIEKLALAGQCTSCHSNPHWLKTNGGIEAARTVYKESGVTCESCHGASSLWDTKHRSVRWRAESPETKVGLGMSDIRNPVTRASICFSCHIGDVSQDRVVTHEMYAAGHPPLPSIELETFLEKMPGHWRTVEEKKSGRFTNDNAFYSANGISESKYRRLESVVLSSAVAFRTSVKLIEQQAARSNKPGGPAWPELAMFDCYSCHHDLKLPSWRQVRANEVHGYKLRPGRPQLLYWPTTLLPLSGQKLDGVNVSLREVGMALDRRPFGDPVEIGLAAGKVMVQVDDLLESIKGVSLGGGDEVAALKRLCALAELPTVDYESARQIGWAFTVILQTYEPWASDVAFREPIEQLEVQLKLNLPWGQEGKIEEQLHAALQAVSDYEPEEFRGIMRKLASLLGK